jgi:hypothetical protein
MRCRVVLPQQKFESGDPLMQVESHPLRVTIRVPLKVVERGPALVVVPDLARLAFLYLAVLAFMFGVSGAMLAFMQSNAQLSPDRASAAWTVYLVGAALLGGFAAVDLALHMANRTSASATTGFMQVDRASGQISVGGRVLNHKVGDTKCILERRTYASIPTGGHFMFAVLVVATRDGSAPLVTFVGSMIWQMRPVAEQLHRLMNVPLETRPRRTIPWNGPRTPTGVE